MSTYGKYFHYKSWRYLHMEYKKKKVICGLIAIVIACIGTAVTLQAKERRVQESLAKEVFRFHVIANSDTEEDQTLKMKVKEAIIAYMEEELPESGSARATKEWAVSNMPKIEETATNVLRAEGCAYEVKGMVGNFYFPDKTYGDVTFPKGYYEALRVEMGEAKGKNWWCVLYPNLCFLDAVHAVVPEEGKEQLKNVLDEEEYEMVTALSKFRIGWFFF